MNHRALALVFAVAAGCADPVANGDYLGQPLFRIDGLIHGMSCPVAPAHPAVGLIWVEQSAPGVLRATSDVAPITATSFPTFFQFDVFNPPPDEAFTPIPPIGLGRMAGAGLVAFDDVDENGEFAWDPVAEKVLAPDLLIGPSAGFILFYFDKLPPGDLGPLFSNPQDIVMGYQLAQVLHPDPDPDPPELPLIRLLDSTADVDIGLMPPFAPQPGELPTDPPTCPNRSPNGEAAAAR